MKDNFLKWANVHVDRDIYHKDFPFKFSNVLESVLIVSDLHNCLTCLLRIYTFYATAMSIYFPSNFVWLSSPFGNKAILRKHTWQTESITFTWWDWPHRNTVRRFTGLIQRAMDVMCRKTCACVEGLVKPNRMCNFRANLRKESSAVLNIYFEVRGSVSSKKSKHIYLSKAPNWKGPCQVCLGQCAKRVARQGFRAVAMKYKRWQW